MAPVRAGSAFRQIEAKESHRSPSVEPKMQVDAHFRCPGRPVRTGSRRNLRHRRHGERDLLARAPAWSSWAATIRNSSGRCPGAGPGPRRRSARSCTEGGEGVPCRPPGRGRAEIRCGADPAVRYPRSPPWWPASVNPVSYDQLCRSLANAQIDKAHRFSGRSRPRRSPECRRQSHAGSMWRSASTRAGGAARLGWAKAAVLNPRDLPRDRLGTAQATHQQPALPPPAPAAAWRSWRRSGSTSRATLVKDETLLELAAAAGNPGRAWPGPPPRAAAGWG